MVLDGQRQHRTIPMSRPSPLLHRLRICRGQPTFHRLGRGKPLRQFIYSCDLAKLFISEVGKYDDVEPPILPGGEARRSVKDVADAVVEAMGFMG